MPKTYTKHYCFFCEKRISSNGLGKASHYRKHVREGLAKEVFNPRQGIDFEPTQKYKDLIK